MGQKPNTEIKPGDDSVNVTFTSEDGCPLCHYVLWLLFLAPGAEPLLLQRYYRTSSASSFHLLLLIYLFLLSSVYKPAKRLKSGPQKEMQAWQNEMCKRSLLLGAESQQESYNYLLPDSPPDMDMTQLTPPDFADFINSPVWGSIWTDICFARWEASSPAR